MQVELQQCMEKIVSSHGFDVESTDRMAIVAKELGQLQRKVLYRCNRSNSESPTALMTKGVVLLGEDFEKKDDLRDRVKSSSNATLNAPPSSPVSLSVKQAVTTLSLHGKTLSSTRLTLDITSKSHLGVETVSLVKKLVLHYQELRPLVLVIKRLLNTMRLNDPYTGGLGSYALVIMVAALLQRRQSEEDDEDEDEDEELSDVSNSTSPATSRSPSNRYRKNRRSDITFGSLNEKLKEHEEEEEEENRRASVSSSRSLDPLRLGEVLLDFLQVYGGCHSIFTLRRSSYSLTTRYGVQSHEGFCGIEFECIGRIRTFREDFETKHKHGGIQQHCTHKQHGRNETLTTILYLTSPRSSSTQEQRHTNLFRFLSNPARVYTNFDSDPLNGKEHDACRWEVVVEVCGFLSLVFYFSCVYLLLKLPRFIATPRQNLLDIQAVKRIHTKTVMAFQKIWTRRTQLLCSAQILIAPVIRKLRTTLQHSLLCSAHFLHLVYHQLTKISKVRTVLESFQNNILAHQAFLNSRRKNVCLVRISLYVLTKRNEHRGRCLLL